MRRAHPLAVGCAVLAVACGGAPTRPTDAGRSARLSRTRFLAFGDSLTAGEVTAPVALQLGEENAEWGGNIAKQVVVPAASYPTQLHTMLDARYPSQASAISVTNAGLGGENTFRAVLRFDDELAANAPDAVIIMHGINNLAVDRGDVLTILIRSMVQSAKNRGVTVFVGSMVPTLPDRLRSQSVTLIEDYNAKLTQMSVEEGVTFVDLYNALKPEAASVIGIDGLHPTEAGYRRIAEVFFTAIASRLEE
jgi:lysophospholipase L1-like esterase